MWDNERTNEQTLKIELLSQWKLEAEFRNLPQLPRVRNPMSGGMPLGKFFYVRKVIARLL